MFNPLHGSINQELFEKRLCKQNSHYEKIRATQKKPSCATTKSTIFTISKDEWNTKEDTGMSMKNALYVLLGWSNTEQWKTKSTLSHCRVMLVLLVDQQKILFSDKNKIP